MANARTTNPSMNFLKMSFPMRFLLSTALFGLALSLRFVILPIEAKYPYLTFYPATILAFLWCGLWAGAWCVILSIAAGFYVFSTPYWSFGIEAGGVYATLFFAVTAVLIGGIAHRMTVASRRLERQNAILGGDEERYRTILQDQTEVICRFRADGTILFVNDAFCRMFGRSQEQLVGNKWQPVVFPDDVPGIEAGLRTLSPTHPVVTIENRIRTADGTVRWAQFVNRAFFDETGGLRELQAVGRDITDRKRLEAELAAKTDELEDLYENAPCGYHSLDASGTFVKINATELRWLGVEREEVIGRCSPTDFFTEEGRDLFKRKFPVFKAQGHIEDLEFDLVGRNGQRRRVSLSATAIPGEDGLIMTRSVFFDVTESHELQKQLTAMNAEQRAMLDNDLVGIVKLVDRRAVWTNRAVERMFGYVAGGLVGASARIFHPDVESFEKIESEASPVLNAGGTYRGEHRVVRRNGSRFWVDMQGVLLSPETGESLWMFTDVTALKERQERSDHLATHDSLTGLPNRRLLAEHLATVTEEARRRGQYVAVCCIDLDGFKPINDGFGHDAGDAILSEIGARILEVAGTTGFPARYGGDEFILILSDLASPDGFESSVTRLLDAIAEPIAVGNTLELRVSASIGVAIYPLHTKIPGDLLRIADEAMFLAKDTGGGRYECFPIDADAVPRAEVG